MFLEFGHSNFEIVSDFDIRISYLKYHLTTPRNSKTLAA